MQHGPKEQPAKVPAHQNPPSQQGQRRSAGSRHVHPTAPQMPPAGVAGEAGRAGASTRFFAGVVLALSRCSPWCYVSSSGGSTTTGEQEPGRRSTTPPPAGVKVYGSLGPENVPLQLGTQLAAAEHRSDRGADRRASVQQDRAAHLPRSRPPGHFHQRPPRSIPLGVGMVPPARSSRAPQGDFATGSADLPLLAARARPGRRSSISSRRHPRCTS